MKRVLSALLCAIMILSCIVPTIAFAGTTSDEPFSDSSEIFASLEPIRNSEITSMRTKNSKTYQMSDGTYQCVVYSENIHYNDARGTLQEIDNTIKTTTAKCGYSFSNTANSWHTYFANKLSLNNAITLEKGNYSISFSLLNPMNSSGRELTLSSVVTTASNAKIAANMTAAEIAENPIYSSLAEDNRVVLYKDVLNNVDISYTVKTGILKEDIILKSASAPNTFEFKLNTTGVIPQKINDTITFNNSTGETLFELAPMYMEDANGKYSEEITYDLIQNTEGYKLTITADSNFLLDPKTVYPVIIDPSVMVTGSSDTFDTCVDQQYPTSNYYLSENLWTGGALGTNAMRTYIKFTLPTGIKASQVTSAYVNIKRNLHQTPTIKGYRVKTSWSSSSVTWNNKPSYDSTLESTVSSNTTGEWYRMYATTIVKNWLSGAYANYGFLLKEPSESSSNQKTRYYSSDAPSPNKPELVINYSTSFYNYSIVHYLDQGYRIRFSSATSAVSGHQLAVTNILEQLFRVDISASFSTYTSLADDCKILRFNEVTEDNLASSCNHSSTHLTTAKLRTELINDKTAGTPTLSRVLWTGHVLTGNPSSNSLTSNNTVIVTPKNVINSSTYENLADATVKWQSRFTLMHESSHQLGAPDHYCYGVENGETHCTNSNCCQCNGKTTPVCIMTSRKNIETTNISKLYCTSCTSSINSHLANHH